MAVIVYKLSRSNFQTTRLHLPETVWGKTVLEELISQGFSSEKTTDPTYPDDRSDAELDRVNELLDMAEVGF